MGASSALMSALVLNVWKMTRLSMKDPAGPASGLFRYSQIERRFTFKFDAHRWPLRFGAVQRIIADFPSPDGSMLHRPLLRDARPAAPGVAAGTSTEKIASSATVVLILPARGPNFVRSNLRTRTILDARGRSPQVPVR